MPYQKLFPPELRTASIVPRWSVVWTLNKDTVANHSYFVTFYARQIGKLIGWKGNYEDLMYYALVHDLDETITGDIVSPVKAAIVDKEAANDYIETRMAERMPHVINDMYGIPSSTIEDIRKIVKAADRLDALLFLITEERLGNTIIGQRTGDATVLFKSAWYDLPGMIAQQKDLTFETMMREVMEHRRLGGFGV